MEYTIVNSIITKVVDRNILWTERREEGQLKAVKLLIEGLGELTADKIKEIINIIYT